MHPDFAAPIAGYVGFVAAALIAGACAERARVPAVVAMVLVGAAGSLFFGRSLPLAFGPAMLTIFLPPLVFEAAWQIDLAALRRMAGPVVLLALPGAACTAALVAAALAAGGLLPFPSAFVFGAIVAATDPVAVSAVFRKLPVPIDLAVLVEGESLANDGTAIVLYATALRLASAVGPPSVPEACLAVVGAIAGGVAIGVALGVVTALVFTRRTDTASEGAATIALAFAAYLLAERYGASGVFATAAAAIALRAIMPRVGASCDVTGIDRFWTIVAGVANNLVFVGTGAVLAGRDMRGDAGLACAAVAAVLVARALLVCALTPMLRARERPLAWGATMYLGGIRGGVALALALALPQDTPYRAAITTAVGATVLATLVAQGLPLERILRRGFRATSP